MVEFQNGISTRETVIDHIELGWNIWPTTRSSSQSSQSATHPKRKNTKSHLSHLSQLQKWDYRTFLPSTQPHNTIISLPMVYRTFPFRLYTILEDSSSDEEECSVISWMPDGKNFKIHDLEAFKLRILPKYLPKQSKYKSFKRQLQYYGFTNHGSNMYGHPSFMRDEKSLLSQIEHRAFKKAAKMEAASALAAASTSSKPSSNSADRVSKAIKTPTDDAGIAFNLGSARAAESAPFESTASLSRDPLSSAFSTHSMFPNQSALYNRLLLSLTGRLPSQGFGFVASASQAADDAALLSSLSQSSSYNSNKVGGDNNGLLSSLLSSQLPSSLMASPSTLLALELEYQRQMRQQQEAASAVRARLLLSLSSNPSTEQQQQQRQESIERLALLNGLGSSLQQQHEV